MKIVEGKRYILANGQITGEMVYDGDGIYVDFPPSSIDEKYVGVWKEDGSPDFFIRPEDNCPEHRVVGVYTEENGDD